MLENKPFNPYLASHEEHLQRADELLELRLNGEISKQDMEKDTSFAAYIAEGEYNQILSRQQTQEENYSKVTTAFTHQEVGFW